MSEVKDKYKKYIDKKCNYMGWYNFFYRLAYVPMKLLFPGVALGLENLPTEGGYIIAFNHRSGREIPFSFYAVPGYRHFVAKEEHYNSAFCRWLFPKLGVIAVNRDKPDLSTIRKVVNVLKSGEVVGIFPEGTRNRDEDAEMLQFKNGTALFALKANVPVVPVYFHKKPRFFRKNHVYIGKPVYPTKYMEGVINTDKINAFGMDIRNAVEDAKYYLNEVVNNGSFNKLKKQEKKRMKLAKKLAKKAIKIAKKNAKMPKQSEENIENSSS
ncbi:MAG: 1-acyl-sn-glycerol-3-phosphate acyltransferase [Clostridia bacterium]|nr:1-acyl-sn-glycerol-3-phosphate acyltransferase [Clostridia bacterium]